MYGEVIAVLSNKEYTISWEDQSKPDSNHYQASKFNCICRATDDEGREDDPALLSDEELWYPGCGACLKRRWHRDLIPDGLDPTSSSSGRKRLSRACCFQTQVGRRRAKCAGRELGMFASASVLCEAVVRRLEKEEGSPTAP